MDVNIELTGIKASFSVPQWFPPDRRSCKKGLKYGGHAESTLMALEGALELCTHPMNKWIVFEISETEGILEQIESKRIILENFFNQYEME